MGRSWQGISLPQGVEIKNYGGTPSVGIRFQYRGVRCRELSLPLDNPKTYKHTIATAAAKFTTITLEMQLGTFRYGNHFPDSDRCRIFGEGETRTRTVEKALLEWLDAIEKTSESATYWTHKRIIENTLIPAIGKKMVSDFSGLDAADLVTLLGRDRVGKTVRNIMLPLRGAFDREVLARTIKANPVKQIKINQHLPPAARKHQVPLPQPFDDAEREAILRVADERMRNMCAVWWGTGMSEGEILGLQWPDLDFVHGKIRLSRVLEASGDLRDRMKTVTRHRELEMTPAVRSAFIAQKRHTFVQGGETVFVNPVTSKPWTSGKALTNYQWRTLLKRAGVAYRGPNQCRHTYAAIRIEQSNGISDLWKLANELGHRGLEMLFKHYGSVIRKREEASGQKRLVAVK